MRTFFILTEKANALLIKLKLEDTSIRIHYPNYKVTMEVLFLLLSFAFLFLPAIAFAPQPARQVIEHPRTGVQVMVLKKEHQNRQHLHHTLIDEIAHELQEMGNNPNIQHQRKHRGKHRHDEPEPLHSVLPPAHGLADYHESLVHKLRRRLHDQDVEYEHQLHFLQTRVEDLEAECEEAWKELEQERDKSLRVAFVNLFKLTDREVNRGVGASVDRLLKILHMHHEGAPQNMHSHAYQNRQK